MVVMSPFTGVQPPGTYPPKNPLRLNEERPVINVIVPEKMHEPYTYFDGMMITESQIDYSAKHQGSTARAVGRCQDGM